MTNNVCMLLREHINVWGVPRTRTDDVLALLLSSDRRIDSRGPHPRATVGGHPYMG